MVAGDSLAFGSLLRRYREAASLTQEALAERARLSARAISDLERGVKHTPRHDTVALLAEALRLSTQERATFVAAARPLDDSSPARSRTGTTPRPSSVLPPFVGRARELALLERHMGGEGPPVLLAGEPGIGKSRLLQEAAQHAMSLGWQVLEGGCQWRGGQEPYAPLLGALKRHIQGQAPIHLRADLQGCAWLVRLLPELAEGPVEPLPSWMLPPEQERRLMFEAVARFLANVAGSAGTLLVLDDLQWASPDALDLLATLVRAATVTPLRVVGAYRDTEVGPADALSRLLADLAYARLATHHTLAPLTPEEAEQLLAGLLTPVGDDHPGLREQVVRRAGGVPFFVVSCAQALRGGEGVGTMPWDLAQGIRQRIAVLPATARSVLSAAAVAGRSVEPALLTAVTARPEEDVLDALEVACQARLLEECGDAAYQFAHDVIREVVEADVGTARRMILHRRVAEALEQWPGEPAVELLAYHYGQSGEQDKAVRYLKLAGDRAQAQYANAAAEGYYEQIVDRLRALGRRLDAAAVCEKLGTVLMTVGRYDAALAVLEQAEETYRAAGDLERWAGALAQMGHLYSLSANSRPGRCEEGVARLQPCVARLEAGGALHGVAMLYAALAELFWGTGRIPEGLAPAERAAEFARAVGDDKLLGTAEERRGTLLGSLVGRQAEALQVFEEARRAAEAAGDLETLCWALGELAHIYEDRGELDTSELYFERARDVAERQGNPLQIFVMTQGLALLTFFRGNWDQARLGLQRAEAIRRQAGVAWESLAVSQGHVALAEGARDEAAQVLEDLEDCVTKLERSGWLVPLREAQRLLAERDLLEGCPDVAHTRLVPLLDRPGLEETGVTALLPLLAWAHLELGELAETERVVTQAIRRMRADNNRLDLVDALRVQAMVAIRQERWEVVQAALEEGVALARSVPYPYAEGRLLHVYGEMHLQKGEPGPARERLEAALAIFRRLGARKDAERVERAIAHLQQT